MRPGSKISNCIDRDNSYIVGRVTTSRICMCEMLLAIVPKNTSFMRIEQDSDLISETLLTFLCVLSCEYD